MKKLIVTILILVSAQTFLERSEAKSEAYTIPSISNQESLESTLIKTDRAIRTIYHNLGLDQVQIQINSAVHEIQKEVLTERRTSQSKSKYGGFFRGLLIGGSFNSENQSSTRLDITQIVSSNPRQVYDQESRATRDLVRLKKSLNAILNKNESNLIIMKELGIIQAATVLQMVQEGRSIPWQPILETLAMVKDINFIGSQTVTRCLSTQHIATTNYDKSSESDGIGLRLLFFSVRLSASSNSQSYHHTFPYTEKKCSSSTNTVEVTPGQSVFAVNLGMLDTELHKWTHAVESLHILRDQAPLFPTWGSPYYQKTKL